MTDRQHREPLYLRALEVWGDRPDLPTRAGELRDPKVYEQDLAEAISRAHAGREEVTDR